VYLEPAYLLSHPPSWQAYNNRDPSTGQGDSWPSSSIMKAGIVGRVLLATLIICQSPLTHSPGGSPISPMGIVAVFVKEQMQEKKESSGPAALPVMENLGKALLFPGNLLKVVLTSGAFTGTPSEPLNMAMIFEEGFELATKKMGWWSTVKGGGLMTGGSQMLLAGSWCSIFGAGVSLASGRMHFLALLGVALFGYVMVVNAMMPTVQFALCWAAVLHGVASRTRAESSPFVEGPAPAAATEADEGKKTK
jgi:hypothetical protein